MKPGSYAPFLLLIVLAFFGPHYNLHAVSANSNKNYIVVSQHTGSVQNTHTGITKSKAPACSIFKVRTKALNDFSAFNVPFIWTLQYKTYIFPVKYYTLYRFHLNAIRCENYSLRGPPVSMLA